MPDLLDSRQLAYNADCVTFCPTEGNKDLLAAGCYQLDEGTGSRGGRLYTYRLQGDGQKLLNAGEQDFPGWLTASADLPQHSGIWG